MLDHLVGGPASAAPGPFAARILTSAASVADPVTVAIAGAYSELVEWGPCPWSARIDDLGAPVYPTVGDRALVAFDEAGQPWIVAWEPA